MLVLKGISNLYLLDFHVSLGFSNLLAII